LDRTLATTEQSLSQRRNERNVSKKFFTRAQFDQSKLKATTETLFVAIVAPSQGLPSSRALLGNASLTE
jgi:hypothetical protein